MVWREQADGRMEERKICPLMSGAQGIVLCQGKHCAAAYPRLLKEETFWSCALIEGHPPGERREYEL